MSSNIATLGQAKPTQPTEVAPRLVSPAPESLLKTAAKSVEVLQQSSIEHASLSVERVIEAVKKLSDADQEKVYEAVGKIVRLNAIIKAESGSDDPNWVDSFIKDTHVISNYGGAAFELIRCRLDSKWQEYPPGMGVSGYFLSYDKIQDYWKFTFEEVHSVIKRRFTGDLSKATQELCNALNSLAVHAAKAKGSRSVTIECMRDSHRPPASGLLAFALILREFKIGDDGLDGWYEYLDYQLREQNCLPADLKNEEAIFEAFSRLPHRP